MHWSIAAVGNKTGAWSDLLDACLNSEGSLVNFRVVSKMMASLRQDGDQSSKTWLQHSLQPDIAGRGLKVALIVGTVLTAINQGDVLAGSVVTPGVLIKILLNYFVPYIVSVYAELEVVTSRQR